MISSSPLHPPLSSPLFLEHLLSFVSPVFLLGLVFVYIPFQLLRWCYYRLCFTAESRSYTSAYKESTKSDTTKTTNSGFYNKNRITWMILLMFYGVVSPILDYYYHALHHTNPFVSTSASSSGFTSTDAITFSGTSQHIGLHDIIHGTDHTKLQQIFERVPKLLQGPEVPVWLSMFLANRHLQFVPWLIQNELHRQFWPIPYQTLEVNVTDCIDKTMGPDCEVHPLMDDIITLDVFPPLNTNNDRNEYKEEQSQKWNEGFNQSSPIILFAPGLTCSSQDMPGTTIIRHAYKAGFRSIVVNRRGHNIYSEKKLNAPRFNILGDVDDMEQVYHYVKNHPFVDANTPLFLYGVSAGTAITVTGLSKWDKQRTELQILQEQLMLLEEEEYFHVVYSNYSSRDDDASGYDAVQPQQLVVHESVPEPPSFVASVAISPGYDCRKVFEPERFLFPYNPFLLKSTTNHFILQNEDVLRNFDSNAVDKALAAQTLQELLDATMVFTGYKNSTLYHQHTNPINKIHDITTPKLILNSYDDPCCNVRNLYERSPYSNHQNKTYATMVAETMHGIIAVTKHGSHCPFLDTSITSGSNNDGGDGQKGFLASILTTLFPSLVYDPISGGYMLNSWADHVTIEYFRASLDVYVG